jgi:uncharacterized protein YbjT (DUF2867 family)
MGQVILIIGGTRGTGLLIAQGLHARGSGIRVLARDPVRAASRLGDGIEIVAGDMTRPETLAAAVRGAEAIIVTAGVRSGHFATEARIRATEYSGVKNVIAAARHAGLTGRFMYMTSSGVHSRSFAAMALNLYKGRTLRWRARLEPIIRESGLDYTIIRAGFLLNAPGGRRPVLITQTPLPLSPAWRIARADVAEAFVAALVHPRASRATFEVVWARGGVRQPWDALLGQLRPDA